MPSKELFYVGMTSSDALEIVRERGMRMRKYPEIIRKNEAGFVVKWTPGNWSLTLARKHKKDVYKIIKAEDIIRVVSDKK